MGTTQPKGEKAIMVFFFSLMRVWVISKIVKYHFCEERSKQKGGGVKKQMSKSQNHLNCLNVSRKLGARTLKRNSHHG